MPKKAIEWTKGVPEKDGWYFWKASKTIKKQAKFIPLFVTKDDSRLPNGGWWYGPIGADA